jgi:hypothetical protein
MESATPPAGFRLRSVLLPALLVYLLSIGALYLYRSASARQQPQPVWTHKLSTAGYHSQDIGPEGYSCMQTYGSNLSCLNREGRVVWNYQPQAMIGELLCSFVRNGDFILLGLQDGSLELLGLDGKRLAQLDPADGCPAELTAQAGGPPATVLLQSGAGSFGLDAGGKLVWTRPDLLSDEPAVRMQVLREGRLLAASQKQPYSSILALNADGTNAWEFKPAKLAWMNNKIRRSAVSEFSFGRSGECYVAIVGYSSAFAPAMAGANSSYLERTDSRGSILALGPDGRLLWEHSDTLRYADYLYAAEVGLYYLSQRNALVKLGGDGKLQWSRSHPAGINNFSMTSSGEVYVQAAQAQNYNSPSWMDWLPFLSYGQYQLPRDELFVYDAGGRQLHRWQLQHGNDWLAGALPDGSGFIACEDVSGGYGSTDHLVCYRWH